MTTFTRGFGFLITSVGPGEKKRASLYYNHYNYQRDYINLNVLLALFTKLVDLYESFYLICTIFHFNMNPDHNIRELNHLPFPPH